MDEKVREIEKQYLAEWVKEPQTVQMIKDIRYLLSLLSSQEKEIELLRHIAKESGDSIEEMHKIIEEKEKKIEELEGRLESFEGHHQATHDALYNYQEKNKKLETEISDLNEKLSEKENEFVIDNLDDIWQKLCFSFYTDICEMQTKIEKLYKLIEGGGK
jgi:septal ring factor EnvC (AmiA/AmiB activator)